MQELNLSNSWEGYYCARICGQQGKLNFCGEFLQENRNMSGPVYLTLPNCSAETENMGLLDFHASNTIPGQAQQTVQNLGFSLTIDHFLQINIWCWYPGNPVQYLNSNSGKLEFKCAKLYAVSYHKLSYLALFLCHYDIKHILSQRSLRDRLL